MADDLLLQFIKSGYALPATGVAAGIVTYGFVTSCALLGRLRLRERPAGAALITDEGPAIGERLESAVMEELARNVAPTMGWGNGRRLAVLFAAPGCTPCRDLLPHLPAVARRWRGDTRLIVVLETAGIAAGHPALTPWTDLPLPVVRDPEGELTGRLGIRSRPAALLLDPSGLVLMKGVTSSGEHLESLLAEHGVAAGERQWKPVRPALAGA